MARSWCLALAAGVGLLTMAGGSALGGPAATPRTLAIVTGPAPDAFAATASGAAWIDAVFGCKQRIRRIHVLMFGRSRPDTLRLRLCSEFAHYGPISFDHGRAVWVQSTFGNTFYEGRVFIVGPGDRSATTLQRFHFDRGESVEPLVIVAGDAGGSVVGLAGPVSRVVGRRTRLLFTGAGLEAVDVSGNRIGVVRPRMQVDVSLFAPPQVEVHARRTGGLRSAFEPSRLGSVAVSTDTVAVWGFDGSRVWVDSYDVRGQKIASKRLGSAFYPAATSDAIGIVGRRVVYSRGRAIHGWDPRSGADTVLANAAHQILNFVVTGRRAIWTEQLGSHRFAIRAVDIPSL